MKPRRGITRRSALLGIGGAGAAAAGLRPGPSRAQSDPERVDIAIVGAGVTGLYCAWRLTQSDPSLRVGVLESSDRIGGRIQTDLVTFEDGETVREEEGAMRFNYGMREFMALADALDLCGDMTPFPMCSDGGSNRYHLRGRNFTAAEAAEGGHTIWSEIYNLNDKERGLSPVGILTRAYRAVLIANGEPFRPGVSPDDWTRFRETFVWNGGPMRDWHIWSLLREMGHSEECIDLIAHSVGFSGPIRGASNAGAAFQIFADFPQDPHFYTFRRGLSTLIDALVAGLPDQGSPPIRTGAGVRAIERAEDGFRVTLGSADGSAAVLSAGRVILAVEPHSARAILEASPGLADPEITARVQAGLDAAPGRRLMKINLYYDRPWWRNGFTGRDALENGPSFTTLPLNSAYPFYALRDGGGSDVDLDAPAALTFYCDHDKATFWEALQHVGEMFGSELQRKQAASAPGRIQPASQAVVAEARRQLAALLAIDWSPEPLLTSYRNWNGSQGFGFGYHSWDIGARDSDIRTFLSQPAPGLHFCNEGISDMQGWINGSLRSADMALAHLGLAPLANSGCGAPPENVAGPDCQSADSRPAGLWGIRH